MKFSRYCFFVSNKRGYFLFSTLFFSILQVDESVFIKLQEYKDICDIDELAVGKELFSVLLENGFLCNSFEDEYRAFQQNCLNARGDDRDLHLTIIPTMNCCFSCNYCFEKKKQVGVISSDTISSVINYIKQKNPDSLHVTWFGGEPLLAIKQIEEFSSKIDCNYHGDYSSDIITTGFHIDKSIVDVLKRCHVSDVQVTIDGGKDNHNRIKYTRQCPDTFSRVIENIDLLTSEIPDIHCIIRVNVTKQNIDDIPPLFSMISQRFMARNVWLSPSLVIQNGVACSEQLFSSDDYRTLSQMWWSRDKIPTKWIYGADRTECAIRKPSSIVVIPDGSICRCWEVAGDEEFSVGRLTKDGSILFSKAGDSFNERLRLFDPFTSETCSTCPYLPICYDGCPIKGIKQSHANGINTPICTSYKDHLDEWLEIYLDYKESQFDLSTQDDWTTKSD